MITNINRSWSAVVFGVTTLSAAVLLSQTASPPQSEEFKSDEYLILGSPNRGAGEPMVFVNPKDSNNIIVVAMATLNRLPTGETPLPRGRGAAGAPTAPGTAGAPPAADPARTALRIKELSTPDGSRTDIAVTNDGGKTWQFSEDNFRKMFSKNRCSDSFAGAGPDGTLYLGCLAYLNRGDAAFADGASANGEALNPGGGTAIAWSTDKGRTWSDPKYVHPLRSPELYAPNVHPVVTQVSPVDRPYFAADAQTGTIYVTGSGSAYTTDPATPRARTFIRASHDQARTWGVIYPIDSDDFPGGRGGFSAAHGVLAVSYTAAKVPASLNAQCPCTVFGTSNDDGKTFTYQLVPELPREPASAPPVAAGRGGGPGGGIMLAADQTKEGRYAVARQSGTKLMVSLTEDGGKTWRPPVLAAQLPAAATFGHRAMKYSATTGALALLWKATYQDRTYDFWSAASLDGGRSFKTVRVSHAISPPTNLERGNFGFGDDLATVDVDGQYVHMVWGDNRSGFFGTWYGRVPLSVY